MWTAAALSRAEWNRGRGHKGADGLAIPPKTRQKVFDSRERAGQQGWFLPLGILAAGQLHVAVKCRDSMLLLRVFVSYNTTGAPSPNPE